MAATTILSAPPWPLDTTPHPSCWHARGRAHHPAGLLQLRVAPPRGQSRAVHALRQRTSSKNLRIQSVRPTLTTESSTADEPPLLRETKLREHTSEDEKPQLPFITRRLSAAIAQLRVRLAAASSLGHTDTYTQTAQRTSVPTGTKHTGNVVAGQVRGGKVASRASAKRRRACNETDFPGPVLVRLGCRPESRDSGADDDC